MKNTSFLPDHVHKNIFDKLPAIPEAYTPDERKALEINAQKIASRYFKGADDTATCAVVITDGVYKIYAHTGECAAGATYKGYNYTSKKD
ncbi:hypothetical protein [Chitinophaga nivalis]|uniref:Uncharacterized protein n=1 Tax=Chitinophaga nivalis TaxID=2991709 RepID=A0ABT3IIM1_9BACT|nr:hypothetical protein [Chitinophaga nivalis]MCW3466484.1 hypothetical protein [Chitinophaga nivalis]MCW3483825.1 hypothetical protein [Chitinophaga nivalis]